MYKSMLLLCITYATFILYTTSTFVVGFFTYLESCAVFPPMFTLFGLFSIGLAACILGSFFTPLHIFLSPPPPETFQLNYVYFRTWLPKLHRLLG